MLQIEKVSLIVLARRGTPRLEQTLASIFEQTYRNFEVTLVVDEMDAALHALIAPYREQLFFVVRQNAASKGRILNDALRMSQGSYFSIIGAGAVLSAQSLATRVKWAEQHPAHWGVCTDFSIVGAKGIEQQSYFDMQGLGTSAAPGEVFYPDDPVHFLLHRLETVLPFTLLRRDACLMSGPFDESEHAFPEIKLWLENAFRFGTIACINRVLGGVFFDVYKIIFHANEILSRRVNFWEMLLESPDERVHPLKEHIDSALKREYLRWAEYLVKVKERDALRRVLNEYVHQYGIGWEWLKFTLAVLKLPAVPERKTVHDFFRTDRLKDELLKIKYEA